MRKANELTGQKFGKLVAIMLSGKVGRNNAWLCRCDCGTEKVVQGRHLLEGSTKSCGCSRGEGHIKGVEKRKGSRLYSVYSAMKQRCYNKNSKYYKHYGERGITICTEWLEDYEAFRAWALVNGYAENLSIDRIDNNLGYYPDNCRWVSQKVQLGVR